MKQRHAEVFLQAFDLVADGRGRNEKLGGCALDTQVARGGFESSQGIERQGALMAHVHGGKTSAHIS